jgi:hypothetical protein
MQAYCHISNGGGNSVNHLLIYYYCTRRNRHFDLLTSFTLKNAIFWDVMPCGWATRATRLNIPEDGILHSHCRENQILYSVTFVIGWLCLTPERYCEGGISSIVFNRSRGWTDCCVSTSCQPPYIWWCIITDSIPISSILQHELLTKIIVVNT